MAHNGGNCYDNHDSAAADDNHHIEEASYRHGHLRLPYSCHRVDIHTGTRRTHRADRHQGRDRQRWMSDSSGCNPDVFFPND